VRPILDRHPIVGARADDISLACVPVAPDRVAGRAVADLNVFPLVAQGCGPGGVGADVVADHLVARDAGIGQAHAVALVAADHVAFPGCRPADDVVMAAARDVDAAAVAQRGCPGRVGADVVARDGVARRIGVPKPDAVAIAADDVALARLVAAHHVRGCAAVDRDARAAVADRCVPRQVRADQVAGHRVAGRAAA